MDNYLDLETYVLALTIPPTVCIIKWNSSLTRARARTHARAHTHAHAHIQNPRACTHMRARTHTHTLTLSLSQAHTCVLAHTHTHKLHLPVSDLAAVPDPFDMYHLTLTLNNEDLYYRLETPVSRHSVPKYWPLYTVYWTDFSMHSIHHFTHFNDILNRSLPPETVEEMQFQAYWFIANPKLITAIIGLSHTRQTKMPLKSDEEDFHQQDVQCTYNATLRQQ